MIAAFSSIAPAQVAFGVNRNAPFWRQPNSLRFRFDEDVSEFELELTGLSATTVVDIVYTSRSGLVNVSSSVVLVGRETRTIKRSREQGDIAYVFVRGANESNPVRVNRLIATASSLGGVASAKRSAAGNTPVENTSESTSSIDSEFNIGFGQAVDSLILSDP